MELQIKWLGLSFGQKSTIALDYSKTGAILSLDVNIN